MKHTSLIIIFLLSYLIGFSQQNLNSISLDLGSLDGTEIKPSASPLVDRRVEVVYLKNTFPKRTYIVTVSETPILLPTLDIPSGSPASPAKCKDLYDMYDEVFKYATIEDSKKTEKELKAKLKALENAVKSAECTDADLLLDIKTLQSLCVREYDLPIGIDMKSGNNYLFSITTDERTFKYLFEGKNRGRFLVNYGFMFTSRALEPSRYYSEQIGTDSFQIKKMRRSNDLDLRFTPTVFFSWFLDKNLNKSWNNSLSVGLGFNFNSPVVGLGYNGMYNQNIGLSAGIAFYEQKMLKGRYSNGQILKENLEEDQLYETSFFRPNIFFALNIRLGQNPFDVNKDK